MPVSRTFLYITLRVSSKCTPILVPLTEIPQGERRSSSRAPFIRLSKSNVAQLSLHTERFPSPELSSTQISGSPVNEPPPYSFPYQSSDRNGWSISKAPFNKLSIFPVEGQPGFKKGAPMERNSHLRSLLIYKSTW